jgi:formylglycine-generating enzyme required for sulfatase activity
MAPTTDAESDSGMAPTTDAESDSSTGPTPDSGGDSSLAPTTDGETDSSTSPTPDSGGAATQPPSCAVSAMGTTNCGPSAESCCASLDVAAGTYDRTYTSSASGPPSGLADPASVSRFRLDKYLVTVGRFRQFVNYLSGSTGMPPADGSGIHTHLNGGRGLANSGNPGSFETGWDAAEWDGEIPLGPSGATAWDSNLTDCLDFSTWTDPAGAQENLPITCVDWYEAYAFCIWDGGFLPSEAEWEYAAAGGSQQRQYPWGSTDPGTGNQYAIYGSYYDDDAGSSAGSGVDPNIAPVGTATLGAGYWGQLDMAGEVFEWNIDWYAPYVDPCTDCAYLSSTTVRVIRGGNYGGTTVNLQAANRDYFEDPTDHDSVIGFRCARSP